MREKWIAGLKELAVTLLIAAFVLGALRMWQAKDLLESDGSVMAPEIELLTMDGGKTALTELRGKPVLLHFWAPW